MQRTQLMTRTYITSFLATLLSVERRHLDLFGQGCVGLLPH
jgi:hypothetical protein